MNVLRSVAKNTMVMIGGQTINMGLNLIITIYFARYLGEEQFGIFSFGLAYLNLFSIIGDFGFTQILFRELSNRGAEGRKILGNALLLRWSSSVLMVIAGNAIAFALRYPMENIIIINLLMLNIFFSSKIAIHRGVYESVFKVNLKMEIPMLLNLLDNLVLLVVMFFAMQHSVSLIQLTMIYTLSNLPGFLLLVPWTFRYLKPKLAFDVALCKFLIKESMPLAGYFGLGMLFHNVDILMVKEMLTDYDVGIYSAGLRLILPLSFIPQAVSTSLFPFMSRFQQEEQEKLNMMYSVGIKVLLVLGLGLSIYTTFMADGMVRILYNGQFQGTAVVLSILIWSQFFYFPSVLLIDLNTATHNQRNNTIYSAVLLGVCLPLDIYMILQWHVIGASIAKTLAFFVGYVFLWLRIRRIIDVPMALTFAKIAMLFLGFAVFIYLIRNMNLIVLTCISGVWFILLILVLQIFSRMEIEKLKLALSWR